MTNTIAEATNILATAETATAKEVVMQEVARNKTFFVSLWDWCIQHGPALLVSIAITAVIAVIGWLVIRVLTKLLDRALTKTPLNQLLRDFVHSVISKTLWFLLAMIVLKRLGLDITPLIAGLGVTGFVLGFAFKDALGNLAAGMMIALNQPFAVGDYVNVGVSEGTVKELNMMMTLLESADGKKIVVPNSVVWGSAITNFSAAKIRRVDLLVGVSYKSDLGKTKETLLAAIRSVPGVLESPAPLVEVLAMADSSVQFAVRPMCKPADYWSVFFNGNRAIKEALDKAGIEIPFPQLDIHNV